MTHWFKTKKRAHRNGPHALYQAISHAFDRLGLRQTENFVLGDPAFGPENIKTFIAFHHITLLANFAANAETRMLGHALTSYVKNDCCNNLLYNMPHRSPVVKYKKRKNAKKYTILLILFLSALAIPLPAAEMTLLAFSDSHGEVAALNRLRLLIENERQTAPDLLLIDAGDSIQGTFEGAWNRGAVTLAMMNAMGVNLWVPGNHDFESGIPPVESFDGTVLGADWHHLHPDVAAWKQIEWRGRRIAVIGIGENRMAFRRPDWRGDPEETALNRIMPEIRRSRPHAIVLVRHGGLYWRNGSLYKLLTRYPEIDLVIGAHSHQEQNGLRVGRAWYVQTAPRAVNLLRIRLNFHESTGGLRRITSELLTPPANGDPPWPSAVQPLLEQAERAAAMPVTASGHTPVDAMRLATGADAALFVGPAELAPLPQTAADLYRLLPYQDRLMVVEITPAVLQKLLDAETGLTRKYPDRQCHFSAVPDWRRRDRLRLAVTDYYLAGSGGLTPQLRPYIASRRDTGILLRDAVLLRNP